MVQFTGKPVCKGIAIGKIKFFAKAENLILKTKIEDTNAECKRYEASKEKAIDELNALYEKAVTEVGEEHAEIFHVHAMMLEDDEYNASVCNLIKIEEVNAEYAVKSTGEKFAEMFANMEDDYFKARSVDIKDISQRVVRILSGEEKACGEEKTCGEEKACGEEDNGLGDEPVILVAEDLTPSETIQMDKSKLLSFVTRFGSQNSHTAILARTMSIPALVGVDAGAGAGAGADVSMDESMDESMNGKMGIVDGFEGKFFVDPDEKLLAEYKEKKEKLAILSDEKKGELQALIGKESVTKAGKKIHVFANIGSLNDLESVIDNDAEGIGLFRSEFLYLERDTYPTEDEQFDAYKKVLETMGDKKVIIRTLDIGADKQVDYFDLDKEENPALGFRAIRICLTRPEIFKTQLRALYRASAYGNLSIMYPMIISVDEVLKIKEISKAVKEELIAEGIKIGKVTEGIMIETPGAAVLSDELAKYVDFFSIGTNDLTQYTLAIDRNNAKLDSYYDPHHKALLRLIKMVCDNGHKEGIWTGICGELGADTTLTEEFLKMGIDELSVSPEFVLPVRQVIREAERDTENI